MRRKDDLLRLAFGELSDDAARAVESSLSAAERTDLEAFRDLRRDLRHLPPPPPDNLSSERLRAAILDRDLRVRRPKIGGLGWAWAPFAVAALAAIAFVGRPRMRPADPVVAMATRATDDGLEAMPRFAPLRKRFIDPIPSAVIVAPQPKADPVEKPAVRPRHHRVRRDTEETIATMPYGPPAPEPNDGLVAVVRTPEPDAVAAPPVAVVAPSFDALPPTTSEDTMVVVSSARDKNTGALAATEVEAANVVVGG